MNEKQKEEIQQLINVWDSQGEGKLTLTKNKDGKIKYYITKGGDLE